MLEEKKTILIAEDEEDLLLMYSSALKAAGYNVLEAKNGKEVFSILKKTEDTVEMILLDIVMPSMDGFETLEKLKKDDSFKNIPVLVSTNLDNAEDRSQALQMGAKEYFVKSQHTPGELVRKIGEFLGRI